MHGRHSTANLAPMNRRFTPPTVLDDDHPFAAPSALPLHYPPFDRIVDADFRPAFEAGMAAQRAEIDAIANDAAAPTFDNTIVAIERSGRMLARVQTVFANLNAADTNDERQTIQREMSPRLSEHRDAIHLDAKLFERVKTLHDRAATLSLDAESRQLLSRTRTLFLRAGAALSDPDKATLRDLNTRLSTLTTRFQQNVLNGTRAAAVPVDDVRALDGLSESQVAAAALAAKARGLDGWLITMQNTTTQPSLGQLKNRALRQRVYEASSRRNISGAFDNTGIVADIVKLRAERASLLGHANHAAYVLEDETAGTTRAVDDLLVRLTGPAIANAKEEAVAIQSMIDEECAAAGVPSFAMQPWDWAFHADLVRTRRHAFSDADIRPYFALDHVLRDGVFFAAERLYGLRFAERFDLPVYHPDVRVFDVVDRDDRPLGLFLADFHARDAKQGGAWMSTYVPQSALFGQKPVIANHMNIPKPAPGRPALLGFDEVTTMFHEFGHALHGLFSDVRYASLGGTMVPRDFVEYPSQYNEMWARDPEVLANYARHHETNEPLPGALLDKVLAASRFDHGFRTTEYLAAATLDQRWHQLRGDETPEARDVLAFEEDALIAAGFDFAPIAPRYRSSYFSHVFSGGYSAGYYAYLWSEVLARDTEAWFHESGGLDRTSGDRMRAMVLSRGRSADVKTLFNAFHGREPGIEPLLWHRGLANA